MSRGRNALPAEVKNLKGTSRKDRAKPQTETAVMITIPAAPDRLHEYAKDVWYQITHELNEDGKLVGLNLLVLETYCQEMGKYWQAESILSKGEGDEQNRTQITDKGYELQSPWVAIGNKALANATKLDALYKLTRAARLAAGQGTAKKEKKSRLADLRAKAK